MPRAIADSDDEGDEIDVFVTAKNTQKTNAALNSGSKDADGASAIVSLNETIVKSTSSTGKTPTLRIYMGITTDSSQNF